MTRPDGYDDDALGRLLHEALAEDADQIAPAGDGLARIRARIGAQRERRNRWLRTSTLALGAAAVTGLAVGTVIFAVDRPGDSDVAGPAATGSASVRKTAPPPPPAPSPSGSKEDRTAGSSGPETSGTRSTAPERPKPAGNMTVAVYYVGDTGRAGPRLYRERVEVPRNVAVIRTALATLSGRDPADPDYRNAWRSGWPAGQQFDVAARGGEIVVDIPARAANRTESAQATWLSLQQLVYTATEAAHRPDAGVRVRVGGQDAATLWGNPIGAQPLRRAGHLDVLAPVWITAPANGAKVGRKVTIKGEASVFEAKLNWEIQSVDGAFQAAGQSTTTGGAPARAEWSKTVTLTPGTYRLRAFEVSPKDGAEESIDSKVVTVE